MGREISTDWDTASRRLPRDAVVTIAALLLVFAAFDDITTDRATSFPLEYTTLIASAVWLLFIAGRVMRHGHGLLGGISLLALPARCGASAPSVLASSGTSAAAGSSRNMWQ